GQAIRHLGICAATVVGYLRQDVAMANVRELGNKLWGLLRPRHMRSRNPLSEDRIAGYAGRRNFVAVNRAADLKAVEDGGPRKEAREPRAIIVDVAAVAGAADGGSATVTQAGVVAQAELARRYVALCEKSEKMYGLKASTEA